jgi:hypothetical protein
VVKDFARIDFSDISSMEMGYVFDEELIRK